MTRQSRHSYGSNNRSFDRPLNARASDQEIKKWVLRKHGFVPESAWIAHCKELFGLIAPVDGSHENPCPPEKQAAIKQAFREFGLLTSSNEPNA
jgi:hypothetical protein